MSTLDLGKSLDVLFIVLFQHVINKLDFFS